jgi:hypothetical protein
MYNDYIINSNNNFTIPNFPNVTPIISFNPSNNNINSNVIFYLNTISLNTGTNLVGTINFTAPFNTGITQTTNFFTNI